MTVIGVYRYAESWVNGGSSAFCPSQASVFRLSVHEVCGPPAGGRLLAPPERELDSSQSDEREVESVQEEDEEEEPEAEVIALSVGLEDEVHLVEVGNPMREMMDVDLRCKENHHQTTAQPWSTDRTLC